MLHLKAKTDFNCCKCGERLKDKAIAAIITLNKGGVLNVAGYCDKCDMPEVARNRKPVKKSME
jgi:hypothetical protein